MARKTLDLKITAAGRDKGKRFVITEMSARGAERWAFRAFLALARAGVDVPEDVEEAGFAGIATFGLKAFAGVAYEDAEPLLDEMLECVQVYPDPKNEKVFRPLIEDDTEEVETLLRLRKEVFALHVDFSKVASLLKSREATKGKGATSPNIETSPES